MKAWKKRTQAEGNDYAAFKVFWEQAIRIADKSIATPAVHYDYGMAIHDVPDDKSTTSRTSALESTISTFGTAYAATEERVRTQTDTINQLQGQLNNLQQMCQSVLTRPMAYPPPMYPPPTQQRNYNAYYARRGGRGGRRTGYQKQAPLPTGPPAAMLSVPNPNKRWDNWNYCHTHGYDVEPDHTSATCTRPGPFHNWQATRTNNMGGSIRAQHKTILPLAGGQQQQPTYGNYNHAPMYPPATPYMQQRQPPAPHQYNNGQPPTTPPMMPQQPMMHNQHHAMAMTAPIQPMQHVPVYAPNTMSTNYGQQQQQYGHPQY